MKGLKKVYFFISAFVMLTLPLKLKIPRLSDGSISDSGCHMAYLRQAEKQ